MRPEEYEKSIREELKHFEPSQRLGQLVLMREKAVKRRVAAFLIVDRSSKEIKLLENLIDREGNIEQDVRRKENKKGGKI